MDETEDFSCDVCGKQCEELWSYGGYGSNPLKKAEKRNFCKEHFDKVDAEYDKKFPLIPESNSENS